MYKKFFVILIILGVVVVSGCTSKTAPNGTFGEKTVSINNITIVNNVTADHYQHNGTSYYYIYGYLLNENPYDAFNLKMKATVYDANNNVVAVNDNVYLNPKVIPAGGESYFYFNFPDPDNKIVRYDLQLISAKAES